jgi:pyruvate formate lyase activating enzyme
MKCVEVCQHDGLTLVGDAWDLESIIGEARRDFLFYLNSGGGVTVSGGEPTTQIDYVCELLKGLREWGINTCVDTCGYCRWEELERLLDYTDLFLYDIKHMDSEKHREGTGVPNELILENARRLAEKGAKLRVRYPVIPDYNDSEESAEAIAKFARSLGSAVEGADVLPFHNYCSAKYEQLGIEWIYAKTPALTKAEVAPLEEIFKSYELQTTIGG